MYEVIEVINNFSELSLLIIAGGKSSRMKQDKRLIEIGGVSLLENILIKASKENFSEIFLCVEKNLDFIQKLADKYQAKILIDEIQNCGPISGLIGGLQNIKNEFAAAISADMPFFEFKSLIPLINQLNTEKVIMFERQPLAAIYHKSLAEIFKNALANDQRKLQIIIDQVPHKIITNYPLPIANYFNVNAPADLRLAYGRYENISRKVPIISIIAPKSGTGKTTFIEKLITKLNEQGLKVGVIKSDSHGFNLDIEVKDSYKFQNAGAKAVAVVSPKNYFMIQQTDQRENFLNVAEKFDNVDLILTESRTHGTKPAISLYRGLDQPLINDDVAALFTDKKINCLDDVLQFDLNDIDQAIKICLFLMAKDL